jgi:hypothetical protein
MSIWTIIAKIIGLVPNAIDAGKAIARALRPTPTINPNDLTLWHTVSYGRGLMRCVVCCQWVDKQNELCPEELRRRGLN